LSKDNLALQKYQSEKEKFRDFLHHRRAAHVDDSAPRPSFKGLTVTYDFIHGAAAAPSLAGARASFVIDSQCGLPNERFPALCAAGGRSHRSSSHGRSIDFIFLRRPARQQRNRALSKDNLANYFRYRSARRSCLLWAPPLLDSNLKKKKLFADIEQAASTSFGIQRFSRTALVLRSSSRLYFSTPSCAAAEAVAAAIFAPRRELLSISRRRRMDKIAR